jgi:hypothetical protein
MVHVSLEQMYIRLGFGLLLAACDLDIPTISHTRRYRVPEAFADASRASRNKHMDDVRL